MKQSRHALFNLTYLAIIFKSFILQTSQLTAQNIENVFIFVGLENPPTMVTQSLKYHWLTLSGKNVANANGTI